MTPYPASKLGFWKHACLNPSINRMLNNQVAFLHVGLVQWGKNAHIAGLKHGPARLPRQAHRKTASLFTGR